jgi:midasin (ATPase involved in ribosome maturation)
VTLEETFDSKNLVGTYVCNETGEFVFKKGPLTVAAEQGLWLVLRNFEQAPPDLLSFLLPLVTENLLKVTSAFSITPKLGFRIVALCQQGAHHASDSHQSIKPFLSYLHNITLDKLDQREDF